MKLKVIRHICAGLVVSAITVASAQARGPYGSIHVGNWNGGAFTDDSNGDFTACIALASYKSGITVYVIVGANMTWRLGFSSESWKLDTGQTFPIILTFDGQQPFNVTATATGSNGVAVDMPDNSTLIAQFRKSKTMSAFAQGQLFQFAMTGTSVLLPTLVNCVTKVKQGGIANAGDFSVKLAPKEAAPASASAPPSGGSLKAETAPGSSPGLQIEAMELASNFILKTSLRNPKLLARSETPVSLVANGAAWRSDEAFGFVRIVPPQEGMKGLDVASAVVANDAKDCKGKFASGRTSELVDSDVVFRGFSSCDDTDGARFSQYFIVSRNKGGFVLFSVVSNMKTEEAKTVTKEEKLVDFKKAALVVVNH
jgi:hypothetical protein